MKAAAAGFDLIDFVHYVFTLSDLAEHAISPALWRCCRVVQKFVVAGINEKLRAGRMRIGGTRHGHGVVVILEAVRCFILYRAARGLLFHPGLEAAALNHEARDHPMKYRVVVVTVFDILCEVSRGFRRFFAIEFDDDIAVTGLQLDHFSFLLLV